MTNHAISNLNGDPSKEGFDQVMCINADKFTPYQIHFTSQLVKSRVSMEPYGFP